MATKKHTPHSGPNGPEPKPEVPPPLQPKPGIPNPGDPPQPPLPIDPPPTEPEPTPPKPPRPQSTERLDGPGLIDPRDLTGQSNEPQPLPLEAVEQNKGSSQANNDT